ncbi:hypothetical protein [Streptomyces cyslabdanicus]|uniref:hypothetical protein n=1 Tax=Streptomyces cyslabdanicus TaxID=1470456 RepID=UPI0040445707
MIADALSSSHQNGDVRVGASEKDTSGARPRLQDAMPANRRQSLGQGDLDFPPIPNGVDYLRSVVDHLDEATGVEPRDIKYAVLHLQAAAEVLLKARLFREHWSLVFKDPGKATTKTLADHSFESCTTIAAVERLRNIARISVSDQDVKALKALADDRNALQHFGLTHNARAVEARAVVVLDFLVRFLDEELLPHLADEEIREIAQDMDRTRGGLTTIRSFVAKRMHRLRSNALKGQERSTTSCPSCGQLALILAAGGGRCHFCSTDWSSGALAEHFQSALDTEQCECPACGAWTLADLVDFVSPEIAELHYCLECAARFPAGTLGTCNGCGVPWPYPEHEAAQLLCDHCQRDIRAQELH